MSIKIVFLQARPFINFWSKSCSIVKLPIYWFNPRAVLCLYLLGGPRLTPLHVTAASDARRERTRIYIAHADKLTCTVLFTNELKLFGETLNERELFREKYKMSKSFLEKMLN